jgi:hypothetical protein
MDAIETLIQQMLPVVGKEAADKLAAELRALAPSADKPFEKAVLNLVADAVTKYGASGLNMVAEALIGFATAKPVKLDWADLAVASDVLAQLERAEAGRAVDAIAYLERVTNVVVPILLAVVKGLIGGAS